jgi:hypothetical protein
MPEVNPLAAIGDTYTIDKLDRQTAIAAVFSVLSIGNAVGPSVIPEVTADGVLWEAVQVTPVGGGAGVAAIAAVGSFQAILNAFVGARMRLGALGSGGPIKVRINTTSY